MLPSKHKRKQQSKRKPTGLGFWIFPFYLNRWKQKFCRKTKQSDANAEGQNINLPNELSQHVHQYAELDPLLVQQEQALSYGFMTKENYSSASESETRDSAKPEIIGHAALGLESVYKITAHAQSTQTTAQTEGGASYFNTSKYGIKNDNFDDNGLPLYDSLMPLGHGGNLCGAQATGHHYYSRGSPLVDIYGNVNVNVNQPIFITNGPTPQTINDSHFVKHTYKWNTKTSPVSVFYPGYYITDSYGVYGAPSSVTQRENYVCPVYHENIEKPIEMVSPSVLSRRLSQELIELNNLVESLETLEKSMDFYRTPPVAKRCKQYTNQMAEPGDNRVWRDGDDNNEAQNNSTKGSSWSKEGLANDKYKGNGFIEDQTFCGKSKGVITRQIRFMVQAPSDFIRHVPDSTTRGEYQLTQGFHGDKNNLAQESSRFDDDIETSTSAALFMSEMTGNDKKAEGVAPRCRSNKTEGNAVSGPPSNKQSMRDHTGKVGFAPLRPTFLQFSSSGKPKTPPPPYRVAGKRSLKAGGRANGLEKSTDAWRNNEYTEVNTTDDRRPYPTYGCRAESSKRCKVETDMTYQPEPFSWGLELGKMADKKPPRSGLPPPHRSQNRAHTQGTLVVDEILPAVDSSPPVMMEEDQAETSSGDAGATDKRHLMYSCEQCKVRLGELTHQAARHFYTIASRKTPPTADVVKRIQQKLHLTESGKRYWRNDRCEVCDTHITKLKEEATNMVHNVDRNRPDGQKGSGIPVPRGHQGNGAFPRTTPHYSSAHHRLVRQAAHRSSSPSRVQSPPLSLVPHPYTETRHHRSSSRRHAQAHGSSRVPLMEMHTGNGLPPHPAQARSPYATDYMQGAAGGGGSPRRPVLMQQPHLTQCPVAGTQHPISPASSSSTSSNTSAAASFFHRAAQKLASSRKKKKHHAPEPEPPLLFPTKFSEVIHHSPPAIPPCLLRSVGRSQHPGTGKVKVMLRICPVEGTRSPSLIRVDAAKKQITIFDPANSGYATTAHRRNGVTAPKMFAFDGICSQDDSLAELCATGLSDIIQAVVNGADGCLFCYGHARLGKTYTMIGVDDRPQNLGVIPCAIAWLFRLIQEQKDKTGARFSVRVSAVEVTGKQETLKDLLADVAAGQEAGLNTAPGVYLREDPICGTQLENQSELRAPTADRAAFYLDAAVAARTVPEVEDDARNSHLLFTIHVYQYRLEKAAKSDNFAGGRSRLHLVDLGSCGRSKDGNALSLSALGNVIMSLLNGQRHVPHRESKLTQLLREAMGSLSCRTCMIAHVSPAVQAYNETLQVVQLASRIHRMKRRRNKFSSASSGSEESSSCDEAGRFRRYRTGIRMGTLRSGSLSDPDYTSSSEQSCDTVIYVGANGQPLSDRELTDNEGPPRLVLPHHVSGNRSGGSSKGSGDETDPFRDPTGIRTQYKQGATSGNRFSSGLPQPRSGSGVVQLPRRINIRTRPGPHPKSKSSEIVKRTEEQWIDGPALCEQRQEPQMSHHPSEQWVDGPRVHQGYTRGVPQTGYNVESGPKKPKKVSDSTSRPHAEHWIDGPREFKSELKSEPIYHELEPLREQAEPSEDVVPPEVQCSVHTNKPETRLIDTEPSQPIISHKPPAMPKHKTVENIQNQEPTDHHVTVPSKVNGSVTSLGVEPDSRPVSTVSICSADQEPKDQTPVPNQVTESPVPVKSFVRAWVEQHSAISAGVVNEDHLTIKTDLFTFLPPEQEQVANVDGQLSKNLRSKFVKDTNTISSTHSSPSMKRLKKGAPSGDSATVNPRTAEWVKCVQEQELSSGLPDQKLSESLGSLISEHPECDQDMISDSLQNLKAEGEITVTVEDTAVIADDTASAPDLSRPSDGDQMAWLTVPKLHVQKAGDNSMLDDSFESENSSGKLTVGGSNLEQMLNSNRQSIYELQMDEKLESASMKRGDACRVYNSTDDSFSDLSLPKDATAEDGHESAKSHYDVEDIDMDKLDSALFCPEPMALDVNGNAPIGQDQEDLGQGQERQPVYETVEEVHYSEPPSQVPFPHDIVRGGQMTPLTSLRKPDGASNPNIHQEISGWGSIESKAQVKKSRTMPKDSKRGSSRNRAVIGHSSDDEKASKPNVQPVQSRGHFLQFTPGKLGFPPKSSAKNSKPAPPPRTSSELSSPQMSINGQISHINSAPTSSTRQSRSGKSSKSSRCSSPQNTSVSSSKTSSAKSSPAKPSPVKSTRLPLFCRSSKSQSSPTKSPAKESKLPTREKSKESKERTKELKEKAKEHRSSSKESKQARSSSSKSPSPNKKTSKKDREGRSPFGWHSKDGRPSLNAPSGSKSDDCASPRRGLVSDSDSGNDSGIGKSSHYNKSKRLLSPYATITKPRSSSHSSSGLGSDNSSMCSGSPSNKWNAVTKKEPTSSGYESMVHESEPFACSSQHDSTSESSSSGWAKKGSKKKAGVGSKRSRSAPARPTDITMSSPPSSCTQSPMTVIRKPIGPSPRAWVDTRQVALLSDDKVEIQIYDMDDIDRMQRRRREEAELRAKAEHRRQVQELLSRQEQLKMELAESKSRLMIDTSTWSFDLYVAEQLDWDDPNDLEALENETEILQKRVDACKSHIMMVTCFDIKA